jgi:hypothetical protein
MNPRDQAARTLAAADHVRVVVLSAEGKVLRTRTPPRGAYRDSPKGRKAWLAQAERQLAREPWAFGEDQG